MNVDEAMKWADNDEAVDIDPLALRDAARVLARKLRHAEKRELHMRAYGAVEAPGDVIARVADELEDHFTVLRDDPYSDRTIGVYSALRELRQRGFREPVAALPGAGSFAEYGPGQVVVVRDEEDGSEFYGVVRRVCGFALLVQARLYGDAGWGKDASGEMRVVGDRRLVRPDDGEGE